jgi:hypothetical protein
MRSIGLEQKIVAVVCAISAGIHAALVQEHFGETLGAGLGFLAATTVLGALALVLSRSPAGAGTLGIAAATFAALIGTYAFAVTTGLPVLHPEADPATGLGIATKAIEAVGLLAASRALVHQPKGRLA